MDRDTRTGRCPMERPWSVLMMSLLERPNSGETESLYQLQDGRIEGGSKGNSIPDSPGLPNRAAIFMAGTQSAPHSSTAAAMLSGSTTATPAGAGSSAPPPAQVLSDLFDGRHTIGASFIYRRSNALRFNNGHTSRGRKLGATSGPSLI